MKKEKSVNTFSSHDIFFMLISLVLSFLIVSLVPNDTKDSSLSFVLLSFGFFGCIYTVLPVIKGQFGWWLDIPFLSGQCKRSETPILFWLGVMIRLFFSAGILYIGVKLTFTSLI